MQDEINEKVVALSVKGAKLTAEMLQKAIKAMLAQAKKQQEYIERVAYRFAALSVFFSRGFYGCPERLKVI